MLKLNKQISKNNYYSFLWHSVFFSMAINFMDVDTIIPAMMVDAGASSVQLGVLTAIMLGAGNIMQLLFAPFLNNQKYKKSYLLTGINTRVAALAGMAMLFFYSSHISKQLTIWAIFILITIFAFSGVFANITYVDIFGKSVLAEKRKAFFSLRQIISGTIVFFLAFLAKWILSKYSYPRNYATLFFIAALLLGIASLGFWKIKEIPATISKIKGMSEFMRTGLSIIREDKNMQNYLFLINIQGISMSLMPFLILFAKQNYSAGSQEIGNYLVFKVIGGVLAGAVVYYFSKKIKYRQMLFVAATLALVSTIAILLKPMPQLLPYFFLLGGIIVTVYYISVSGILLEFTNNENRALYTGVSGAGNILPSIFPIAGGWIIAQFGFDIFFGLFILTMLLSFYFIKNIYY